MMKTADPPTEREAAGPVGAGPAADQSGKEKALANTYAAAGAEASAGETDDAYPAVARLGARWRVIVCRDGIQWILQRRRAVSRVAAAWEGRRYCATREGLIRDAAHLCGEVDPDVWAMLKPLPATIRGQA